MAISEDQIKLISLEVKKGDLSNVKIAERAGCTEATVRRIIKKYGLKKNEFDELADREITNLIMRNEINDEKTSFDILERRTYDEVLIRTARNRELILDVTQKLVLKVGEQIDKGKKTEVKVTGSGMGTSDAVLVEAPHTPADLKALGETIDRASITMGVSDRHAPKGDTTTNVLNVTNDTETDKGKF